MKYISSFFACFSALFMISGCDNKPEQQLPARNWELVWSDDFDGLAGTAPDATKWDYDRGRGLNGGWGNNELQYYTDRPQNVAQDGKGNLVITAIKESFSGANYTSARIKTQGKFTQKYGKFEARLKTPYGQGLWPAFWMLGDNVNQDNFGWPKCGEIDIMEQRGALPSVTNSAIHGPGFSGANPIQGYFTLYNNRFDKDFHTYSVEWFEDRIDFFVDDYLFQRITKADVLAKGEWVYDHPFFMLLNVAVGGNYGGVPAADTFFPQQMVIDYVKVYKAAP
jgi:beta-glucanase (GH16 family)